MKNKLVISTLIFSLAISSAAFAREVPKDIQTASAVLDADGIDLTVYVDLSDGYSVDFATGAVYLYKGSATGDEEPIAMGITLERQVYDEYVSAAEDKEPLTDRSDVVSYTSEGENLYLYNENGAYFLIIMDDDVTDNPQDRFYLQTFTMTDETESEAITDETETEAVAVETETEAITE
jgi:hypothetical protein